MSQPIRLASLTAKPAAGFEQPFEMLEACHERVQRMLTLLARLREHARTHGADTQAQQAARDVMRYFDQAAPQHHRDEELHVFPPLLARGQPQQVALVQRLQQDHLAMASRWADARAVLARVQQGEPIAAADEPVLDAFVALHGDHLRAEEALVYPAARSALDDQALAAMSEDMMRRRGLR
jgi:hemerythrin-like domain-containing protein